MAAYDAALTLWPVAYQSVVVPTRWGNTHLIVSGPKNAPPVVLLHGMNLSATMWFANVADLSNHYRIYALDIIGSAGKSIATHPLKNRADAAGWLDDVLNELEIAQADLVGHSYGGWLTLNFALHVPQRIKRMVLLAPAASLLSLVSQFYLRGIPAVLWPRRSLITSFMNWMAAEEFVVNELFVEQLVMGMKYFRPQISVFPTKFSDEELGQIKVPTLLLIGAQEVIYNPKQAVDRAKQLIANIEAEVVPKASHGLPMEQPSLVNACILDFLRSA